MPAGFCATLFADAIGHARHLVVAESGVVYVNTFNNPTGERYTDDELRELVRWASEHGVFILHDTVSSDVASTVSSDVVNVGLTKSFGSSAVNVQ